MDELVITGRVLSGLGRGGGFVALEWVRREIRQKFGFEPYPGTLNLQVADPLSRRNLDLARSLGPVTIEPPTAEFCTAQGIGARVKGVAAALIFPEATVHDEVVLEVVAPLHLRSALELRDGDTVRLEIEAPAPKTPPGRAKSVDAGGGED